MTKLSFVLAASLAAFGCKKKDGDAAGGGGLDCATVVSTSVDRASPDMKKDMPLPDDKFAGAIAAMKATLMKDCTEDKWPDAELKCLNDGKNAKDYEACDKKNLPEAEQKKVEKDLQVAMEPFMKMDGSPGSMGKPADPAAGSAAPAAGSDTGSAAAPPAAPAAGSDGSAAAPAAGSGSGS
jgi:hypothetical protein